MAKYCGREFSDKEIEEIRMMRRLYPNENRTTLSKRICRQIGWFKVDGGLKDMSCRVALLRMEKDSLISLPPPQSKNGNGSKKITFTQITDPKPIVNKQVHELFELTIKKVTKQKEARLWNEYIERYHYLGYTALPGAQIRYIVRFKDEVLALLGFGASAWMVASRDSYIGWSHEQRKKGLHLVINNARFLILPWIQSRNLGSKILSLVTKRIVEDWQTIYNYSPVLIETFVQINKFSGAVYKASNWICVGKTKGRGKLEKHNKQCLPIKYVFLYPLVKNFRNILCS
jgi:hypothetical protein